MVLASAVTAAAGQDGLAGWVTQVMESLGSPGVGLLIALENVFPPIPSELVLPLAGFAAGQGAFGLIPAMLWATVGSVLGALLLFWLGHALGRDRLIRIIDRMPLVHVSSMLKAEEEFARHGRGAVFFGRLVPGVRSLVSIPAGLSQMPLMQFTLYTAAGSLVWNAVLIYAGYALGARWSAVEGYVQQFQYVVIAVVTALFVYAVYRRIRRSRTPGEREKAQREAERAAEAVDAARRHKEERSAQKNGSHGGAS